MVMEEDGGGDCGENVAGVDEDRGSGGDESSSAQVTCKHRKECVMEKRRRSRGSGDLGQSAP